MYHSIESVYQKLFPHDTARGDFVRELVPGPSPALLDAGCGTGELVIDLAGRGFTCSAFDPNERMIETARANAAAQNLDINFATAGMENIFPLYKAHTYDAVTCFGNTLPHLKGHSAVHDFFRDVHGLLHEGGVFSFQIMNYRHLQASGFTRFPAKEIDGYTFKRQYANWSDASVDFTISLTAPDGKTENETIRLLNLKEDFLTAGLTESGFARVDTYENYGFRRAASDSLAVLFAAHK